MQDSHAHFLHLVPYSVLCRNFLVDLIAYFCGRDSNNATISNETAIRFIHGYQVNDTSCLLHSTVRQPWNIIRFQSQKGYFGLMPEILILPCMIWANQLSWDGVRGFRALFIANSTKAYVATGACDSDENCPLLYWNDEDHKGQIAVALEAFGDGFADIVCVQCSSERPELKPLFAEKCSMQSKRKVLLRSLM